VTTKPSCPGHGAPRRFPRRGPGSGHDEREFDMSPGVGAHEGAHVFVAVLAKEIQRPTQTSPITAQRLSWFPSRRRITSPTITIKTAGIAIRFHFWHSFESFRFHLWCTRIRLKAFDFHQAPAASAPRFRCCCPCVSPLLLRDACCPCGTFLTSRDVRPLSSVSGPSTDL
jgi:hypothetical protein